MHGHGAAVAREIVVPHALEDGGAGQDLLGVLEEQGEQVELLPGQGDGALAAPDLAGGAVASLNRVARPRPGARRAPRRWSPDAPT